MDTTTKQDIQRWLNSAQEKGCSHLIVVCDTFDWGDYPVYVGKNEDIHQRIEHFRNADMQKIMEVYNLSMDIDVQMNEVRAYHI